MVEAVAEVITETVASDVEVMEAIMSIPAEDAKAEVVQAQIVQSDEEKEDDIQAEITQRMK